MRGMWISDARHSERVLADPERLVTELRRTGISDVYLRLDMDLFREKAGMEKFVEKLSIADIRVWAMEGSRRYFYDADGPAKLYEHVLRFALYNRTASKKGKLCGLLLDNRPHDHTAGFPDVFHRGVPTSRLNEFGRPKSAKFREYIDDELTAMTDDRSCKIG